MPAIAKQKSPPDLLTVQQQSSKQQNDNAAPDQSRLSRSTTRLLSRLGLKYIGTGELTIRRQRHGRGFGYVGPDGRSVGTAEKQRLASLAELGNTPAICRKSYVHEAVVNAFEEGELERFADSLRASRSTARRAKVLAKVAAQIETDAAA
jgi:DNA topoisomerase IB